MASGFRGTTFCFLVVLGSLASIASPPAVEMFMEKGMEAVETERYLDAIPYFDNIINLDPENSRAYAQRGRCHLLKEGRDLDRAMADFQRVAVRRGDIEGTLQAVEALLS